jgi:hypothetical protein
MATTSALLRREPVPDGYNTTWALAPSAIARQSSLDLVEPFDDRHPA